MATVLAGGIDNSQLGPHLRSLGKRSALSLNANMAVTAYHHRWDVAPFRTPPSNYFADRLYGLILVTTANRRRAGHAPVFAPAEAQARYGDSGTISVGENIPRPGSRHPISRAAIIALTAFGSAYISVVFNLR